MNRAVDSLATIEGVAHAIEACAPKDRDWARGPEAGISHKRPFAQIS